ncbi:MAG: hypothetical protein ABUL47_04985, partial [Leifsonia sp.]
TTATTNYDPLGLPSPTIQVDVTLAADAPPAQWGAATALVRSAAGSRELAGTTSKVVFRQAGSATSVTVEPMFFTADTVTAEIAAWHRLTQVVGERVSLHLGHESGWTDFPGPILREYDVQNEADARQVAALWPDTPQAVDPTIPTQWKGPGLQWPGMPTKAMMTSLSAVGAALPLASADQRAKQSGTFVDMLPWSSGYRVTIVSLRDGELTTGHPTAAMARAVQAAFATGANSVEWESEHVFASLLAGSCPMFRPLSRPSSTSTRTTGSWPTLPVSGSCSPQTCAPGRARERGWVERYPANAERSAGALCA